MLKILPWIPVVLVWVIAACSTVPITGRRQLIIIPESTEISEGEQAYRAILRQSVISKNPEAMRMVRKVGEKIARVANKPDYQWEFAVIDDPEMANAFAVPGGKVAVYTGIFPPAKDEAGLAVVLGHEVAHALARHGAERMSQSQLLQLPAVVGAGFGVNSGLLQAYGLGAAFGIILPFSRSQELEADRIGLRLMAEAGYDPRASLDLWERMEKQAAAKGQGAPPGFMSTHPGYEQRTQQLREWIPNALNFYRASQTSPEPLPSLETLNTPEAMAERALLKRIEAVNQQSGDQRRAEAMLRALQDRIGGTWSGLVREFNEYRVSVGEFAALKGTSYLGKVPMAQVVGSYKNNATWTEITQRQGVKVTDLLSFLTDLIRLQARWR